MKKLISSTLAVMTSFALLTHGSTFFASAADSLEIPVNETMTEEIMLGDIDDFSLSYPQNGQALSNFGENGYCFYDFLDDNNKLVYQQLVSIINEPTASPVSLKLAKTVSVSVSSLPSSEAFDDKDRSAYEEVLFGCCKPAIDSLMFDFPELCWMDVTQIAVRPGSDISITRSFRKGTYTIRFSSVIITPAYYSAFKSRGEVESALDDLWQSVADFKVVGDTRYEKVKSIHDSICKFTYYDLNAPLRGSALGALVKPGVVCEGYAKAFKLICDREDIPCVVVYGNESEEDDSAHMWDYVQMEDGKWYGMDVTWDDLDGEYGREVKYEYFLKGSKNFNRVHKEQRDYNITYFNYPEISLNDYVFTQQTPVSTTTTASEPATTTSTTTTITKPPTILTETVAATTTNASPYTTTSISVTALPKLKCDLNQDGEVNVADLVYCANAVHGTISPVYSCDANNDGFTDVFDVIFMRKYLSAGMTKE